MFGRMWRIICKINDLEEEVSIIQDERGKISITQIFGDGYYDNKIEYTPPKMAKSEELLEKWSIKKQVLWKEKNKNFVFYNIFIFFFVNLFYV